MKKRLLELIGVFGRLGLIAFGGPAAHVGMMEREVVSKRRWMTKPELLDAIAIGQFTPGPVLSTATFIGYQIGGWSGAALATVGIFLPSFLFVWLLNPLIPRLRSSKVSGGFLDGVNMGAVAIMLAVGFDLSKALLTDVPSWTIATLAVLASLLFKKIPTPVLVVGGAIAGYLFHLLGQTAG